MKTRKSIWSLYCVYIKKFSERTSLHGFKFVLSYKLSNNQRLIWFATMILTMCITCWYLWQAVTTSRSNFMTTNIDTMQQPIEDVEFPSVLVCSYNLVRKSKAEAIMKEWTLPPLIDKKKLFAEIKIFPLNMLRGRSGLFVPSLLTTVLAINKISGDMLLRQLAVPCEELMVRCEWKTRFIACSKMFRLVKSYDGFCCAFNYFADVNSTVDAKGLPHKSKRIASTSYRNGLTMLIKTNKEDYFSTMYGGFGSKILVSSPWSYPDETSMMTVIKPNQLMMISYIPSTTITSQEALDMDRQRRQCIHGNEGQLTFFKTYSYKNCITECKINITEKYCNCVLSKYPKQGNHRVCDLNDLQCLATHQEFHLVPTVATLK